MTGGESGWDGRPPCRRRATSTIPQTTNYSGLRRPNDRAHRPGVARMSHPPLAVRSETPAASRSVPRRVRSRAHGRPTTRRRFEVLTTPASGRSVVRPPPQRASLSSTSAPGGSGTPPGEPLLELASGMPRRWSESSGATTPDDWPHRCQPPSKPTQLQELRRRPNIKLTGPARSESYASPGADSRAGSGAAAGSAGRCTSTRNAASDGATCLIGG
ncbi:MAG: hypothetical protein JWO38_1153 [Gemmataceae bacterium]|nr:hypothetical protein [Gemmataceae bacterium]